MELNLESNDLIVASTGDDKSIILSEFSFFP